MKLFVFLICVIVPFVDSIAASQKPNVIFILTDDQGSIDVNCYGARDLVTPHMDRIARHGTRFTQFYAAAPVCAPSRAACMTGKYPQRAGVVGNVGTRKGDKGGLHPRHVTMAEMFQKAGYATAHIGKWHLGFEPQIMPNAQGFAYSFGHMGGCIDNYSHFYYWNGPNEHDLYRNGKEVYEDGKFFGDLMVREAAEFIESHRDQPFFIYFAINMPHYPYQGDTKWLRYYKDLKYPRNLYAAFISTIDDRIGQLQTKLDELDLTENTIIVFQSDHGHSEEVRAHRGGGNSGPFRGHKFQLLEGGIRVPALISWPGQLPQGETRHQFATACDWYPTLAQLCHLELPNQTLDGKSLVNVIRSATQPTAHDVFHWESGGQFAVRRGNWKLYATKGKRFLYDLASDPGENNDLKSTNPNVLDSMTDLHNQWRSQFGSRK